MGLACAKLEGCRLTLNARDLQAARANLFTRCRLHLCAGVGGEAHVQILARAHFVTIAREGIQA